PGPAAHHDARRAERPYGVAQHGPGGPAAGKPAGSGGAAGGSRRHRDGGGTGRCDLVRRGPAADQRCGEGGSAATGRSAALALRGVHAKRGVRASGTIATGTMRPATTRIVVIAHGSSIPSASIDSKAIVIVVRL